MSDSDEESYDSSITPPPRKSRSKKSTTATTTSRNEKKNHESQISISNIPDPYADTVPTTSTAELAAGISRWIDSSQNFFYVELSSLVLLFAVVALWDDTKYLNAEGDIVQSVWMKYALSVACVSLGICLILQTLEFLIPGFLEWNLVPPSNGSEGHRVEKVWSVVLLLWWCIGTGIITFKAPFVNSSNGWFGAWGGLLATMKWAVGITTNHFRDAPTGIKYLKYLAFTSIVLVFASIPPIRHKWLHWEGAGFSIAASALTLIATAYLLLMYGDIPRNVMKLTVVLLFILWVCVAGVCTFHGPFVALNNGYFACWFGLLCALRLSIHELNDQSPESDVI
mmetsp:Transcript_16514/g.31472  ORF Transcript_16514/g.31472 Transcript_16514/m.31472 type:complete len:339 (+) Transcript_16514:179-1195(+)